MSAENNGAICFTPGCGVMMDDPGYCLDCKERVAREREEQVVSAKKHTEEPWFFEEELGKMGVRDFDKSSVGEWTTIYNDVDLRHAVACVNALKGLNPEAIGGLVEGLRQTKAIIDDVRQYLDFSKPTAFHATTERGRLEAARSLLAQQSVNVGCALAAAKKAGE